MEESNEKTNKKEIDEETPQITARLPEEDDKIEEKKEAESKETREIPPEENKTLIEPSQSVSTPLVQEKPDSQKAGIDMAKYDGQVKTLKNLGYSAQQIIDNLLRLNPELHEKKHITADIVYKYFPRPTAIPVSQETAMSGGIELTEALKSFIESILRRQLDSIRAILEEERKRRPSFLEALSTKTLEWGPVLLVIQIILAFSFLLYKGGLECVKFFFYGPFTPLQFIPYVLLCLFVMAFAGLFFFRDEVYHERQLDDLKAVCYLLLFPLIFSASVTALERNKNETNWNNFLRLEDKNYFLDSWFATDYKDRVIFQERGLAYISMENVDEANVLDVSKALIYSDINLTSQELRKNYPDLDREITICKAVLLYDDNSSHRKAAVSSLEEISSEGKEGINEMEASLSGLSKCFKTKKLDYSKQFLNSPKKILRKMSIEQKFREKIIKSILDNNN